MFNKSILWSILGLVVVAAAGYFLIQTTGQPASLTDSQGMPVVGTNTPDVQVVVEQPTNHEVVYTANGFAPATLAIKIGDTVMFKNQSGVQMWVASVMHPTHMGYGGTSLQDHCPDADNSDFDQCQASANGQSWAFTFNKIGTWGYHNHSNAKHFGKIIVE